MVTTDAPKQFADFTVISRLGAGGNGTFYLAEPPARLNLPVERVALKVFDGMCSDDAYRRGVRELRAFAAVDSPYLADLYDAVLQGQFMYAMEYFPNGSLHEPKTPMTVAARMMTLADAARGVHALHEAGIAHGNITPAAVMIADNGGGKISDLGLSRVLTTDEPLTSFTRPASVQYVDPALLAGAAPSRASDIWSLGAVLHRALTGQGLYGPTPDAQPMLAIRAALSNPPTFALPQGTPAHTLVADCLGLSADRPTTAAEVADRIDSLPADTL